MELTNLNNDRKNRRKANIDTSTLVYGKVPPQSKDLEKAVIGALMLEKEAYDKIGDKLKAECFYVDAHQRIFKAISTLKSKNLVVDVLTVVEQLKFTEELEIIGGPWAVTELTNGVMSSAHIEDHADIILKKFIQREIIRIGGEAVYLGYEDTTLSDELLEDTLKQLDNLNAGRYVKEPSSMLQNVMEAKIRYDNNRERPQGQISGVSSGFKDIDICTYGWQPTDLIIFAARPSIGKSAISTNFASNAAKKGIPAAYFSLEMSASQLVNRIISAESGVDLEKIDRGQTNEIEDRIVNETLDKISHLPIIIDDTAGLSIIEFRSKARRLVRKHKVGLFIIDYLQLMYSSGGNSKKTKDQEIGEISRELKKMAKELEVPIIALSQLNRAVETRKENPVPTLADLRDSGNIEQDADLVLFLYNEDDKPKVRIAKHRNGKLKTITLKKDLSIQKFYDAEQGEFKQLKELPPDAQFDDAVEETKYNF